MPAIARFVFATLLAGTVDAAPALETSFRLGRFLIG